MDVTRTKYYTKTSELKEKVIEYLEGVMDKGSEADKKEIALAILKSRLFDETVNVKGDGITINVRKYGEDDNSNTATAVAEAGSGQ